VTEAKPKVKQPVRKMINTAADKPVTYMAPAIAGKWAATDSVVLKTLIVQHKRDLSHSLKNDRLKY